ncbi:MAG: hypothetical protein FJ271_22510 [Planctomycetes bacterium]|nr:hypothetical protein [Planctomycetota bacterium]
MPCTKFVAGLVLLLLLASSVHAGEKADRKLQSRFEETVQPFLKSHCITCHGAKKNRGDVTLHEMRADPKDLCFASVESGRSLRLG